MAFIFDRQDERQRLLYDKCINIENEIKLKEQELEYDEAHLDLFERYNWDVGIKKLAEPRKRYLAEAGMKISPEDKEQYWLVRGQYEEACKLCMAKDELVEKINQSLIELERKKRELLETKTKLDKLKE